MLNGGKAERENTPQRESTASGSTPGDTALERPQHFGENLDLNPSCVPLAGAVS